MVQNYNLNVTEVRNSEFKNASPGIFNFTAGILTQNKTSLPCEILNVTGIFSNGVTIKINGHIQSDQCQIFCFSTMAKSGELLILIL